MRVYLPATLPLLAGWHGRGVTPAALDATAVTSALREWYAEGDDEELEWAAQTLAARSSLRLLNSEVDGPFRRVVVAADVPDADVVVLDASARGAVRIGGPVARAGWVAVLLDGLDASPLVRRAAAAIALADHGDDDAAFTVSDADDAELQWFAVSELPGLLA